MNGETTRGRKGRQPRPELQREYSDLTKQKHEQIVKKLLEEFDLEETKEKYRVGAEGEISYEPKSKGLADYQFRSDLRRLMGSDVIHLNDQRWNDKLHSRLREEYEKRMDRKEEELAQAESNRIRQLKIDGLISMADDNTTKDHQQTVKKKGRKIKGRPRKGHHSRRKRSPSPSHQRARCNSAPSRSVTFYRPPEDIPTQVELLNKSRSVEDGSESNKPDKTQPRPSKEDDSAQPTQNNSFSSRKTSTSEDLSQQKRSNKRKQKKVPQEIQNLYQEESVDGLYSMAERLVIIDTSSKKQEGRVRVTSS